jgi:hypothetical protein
MAYSGQECADPSEQVRVAHVTVKNVKLALPNNPYQLFDRARCIDKGSVGATRKRHIVEPDSIAQPFPERSTGRCNRNVVTAFRQPVRQVRYVPLDATREEIVRDEEHFHSAIIVLL